MKLKWASSVILIYNFIFTVADEFLDKPCAARAIANRSVVCVCTADYCDTIIRENPTTDVYFKYVTSEAGLRFAKSKEELRQFDEGAYFNTTLVLDPTKLYQTVNGFGTSISDAAGINWKNLTDPQLMNNLIESICGATGLEYSMLRVPIGGTDYSTHGYAYNEYPENDVTLSNFTLAYEDFEYKIPMIKACMKAAKLPIDIVASTWSPAKWFKTNNNLTAVGRLKKEYYPTYALYHLKFLEEYQKENIPIWGITTTNEPFNCIMFNYNKLKLNCLGWGFSDLADWIQGHLGPTIRNSTFKNIKIITGDDQRSSIGWLWSSMIFYYPGIENILDGVAVHYYQDSFVPPTMLTVPMEQYPDKFVIATEAASGTITNAGLKIDLGSWPRAEDYFLNILEDLNHNVIGWIDWNACLNMDGGPTYVNSLGDSQIIVDAEAGEFLKQPMFYAVGHFSKFVPRGSLRIGSSELNACETSVQHAAFLTPENTVVVVLYNANTNRTTRIRLGDREAVIELIEKSFTTIELYNK